MFKRQEILFKTTVLPTLFKGIHFDPGGFEEDFQRNYGQSNRELV